MLSRLMKRIGKSSLSLIGGLVLIGFAVVYACGQIPDAPEAESAVGITAPDGYAVSCATGYTRRLPHFCAKDTPSGFSFTDVIACTQTTLDVNVPTSAKMLLVTIQSDFYSNGGAGFPSQLTTFYGNVGCTGANYAFTTALRNETALSSGTNMGSLPAQVIVLACSGGKVCTTSGHANTTTDGDVGFILINGYYD